MSYRCLQQYNLMNSYEKNKLVKNKESANIKTNFKLTHMNVFISSSNNG